MSERVLYPDEEQRRRIMDLLWRQARRCSENGAEVFRVEQTMEIMARSFHLRSSMFLLTNGIFASAGTAEISEVRNVPVRTTHLGRVAAVNELSARSPRGGSRWTRQRPSWPGPSVSRFRTTGCSWWQGFPARSVLP